ncbi:MAG: family 43 glycosylhydrolase [Janthinobacterium lividum]
MARTNSETGTENPVLLGDHPDPTIIRVGHTYWTTSTSGDWAPEFPLYRSTDLHHWTSVGAVFPRTPSWAKGDFWAPELVYDRGHVLLYYVARKRDGPLCVAAATAAQPEGPYEDKGPLLCQPDGSIDPSFVRDEKGVPYLIWKEDANSIGKPTPIFAQPLADDLLHLTGVKVELIRNDPASWEGGVVEGPYILHHAGRFYLFYAGNACCGNDCRYAEGVARSNTLLGPWEKDPANPIIVPNGVWKCPGHGTAVEDAAGHTYLIYHAYPAVGTIYLGRESLLDRVEWDPNGWPVVNKGLGPSGNPSGLAESKRTSFADSFTEHQLDPGWRWPINRDPVFVVGAKHLQVHASGEGTPVFLARSLASPAFVSTLAVDASTAAGGLVIIGGVRTQLTLLRTGAQLRLVREVNGQKAELWTGETHPFGLIWLRVATTGDASVLFSYSNDGVSWTSIPKPVSIAHFPPWDQGLRIGVAVHGAPGTEAGFKYFTLTADKK